MLRLRQRQMRNLAAALLLSHGVPMILMGDEYGHSKVTLQRLRPKPGACTAPWPNSCWHDSQGPHQGTGMRGFSLSCLSMRK